MRNHIGKCILGKVLWKCLVPQCCGDNRRFLWHVGTQDSAQAYLSRSNIQRIEVALFVSFEISSLSVPSWQFTLLLPPPYFLYLHSNRHFPYHKNFFLLRTDDDLLASRVFSHYCRAGKLNAECGYLDATIKNVDFQIITAAKVIQQTFILFYWSSHQQRKAFLPVVSLWMVACSGYYCFFEEQSTKINKEKLDFLSKQKKGRCFFQKQSNIKSFFEYFCKGGCFYKSLRNRKCWSICIRVGDFSAEGSCVSSIAGIDRSVVIDFSKFLGVVHFVERSRYFWWLNEFSLSCFLWLSGASECWAIVLEIHDV